MLRPFFQTSYFLTFVFISPQYFTTLLFCFASIIFFSILPFIILPNIINRIQKHEVKFYHVLEITKTTMESTQEKGSRGKATVRRTHNFLLRMFEMIDVT